MENIYFASCPKEMEQLLRSEIESFGVKTLLNSRGGVLFEASPQDAIKVLLHTRLASRVFRRLDQFPVSKQEDIYENILKTAWNKILSQDQTFKVQTLLDFEANKVFSNSLHLSYLVKDAICDQYRKVAGGRPSVDKASPDLPLLLRIEKDDLNENFIGNIYIDLSGRSLSHRGYRPSGHRAPLRENVAAAIIMASDWDPQADLFCDPFCGTGTLVIEAVLIKANIAPSYIQMFNTFKGSVPYTFLKQKWFLKDADLKKSYADMTQKIVDHARLAMKVIMHHQFYASDYDKKTFPMAVQSFKNALIPQDVIKLSTENACHLLPPGDAPGIIMTNPPYGERINPEMIEEIYYQFGENLKNNWKNWRAYLLTSNFDLRKKISLQTSERIPFVNGDLECRLLKYQLY